MIDQYGIPTTYNNVNFRSRLEARWAIYFDLLGLRWEYEPIELAGYVADFVLPAQAGVYPRGDLLLEVKSASSLEDPLFEQTAHRIRRAGWVGQAAVLGCAVHPLPQGELARAGCVKVGLWLDRGAAVIQRVLVTGQAAPGWVLTHADWSEPAREPDRAAERDAVALWRDSGNKAQWMPVVK